MVFGLFCLACLLCLGLLLSLLLYLLCRLCLLPFLPFFSIFPFLAFCAFMGGTFFLLFLLPCAVSGTHAIASSSNLSSCVSMLCWVGAVLFKILLKIFGMGPKRLLMENLGLDAGKGTCSGAATGFSALAEDPMTPQSSPWQTPHHWHQSSLRAKQPSSRRCSIS